MSEKQFPPSIRRLNKARKDGKIVKSRLVSVCVSWWFLILLIGPSLAWVRDGTLIQWLNYKVWTPQVALSEALWEAFKISGLLVGIVAGSGLIAGLAQTRGLFLPSQLLKGFEQYKPGAYIGRLRQNVVDALLGIGRCSVVLVFVLGPLGALMGAQPTAIGSSPQLLFAVYWSMVKMTLLLGGVSFTLLGVVAYALVRWKFYRQMRMSLQEVRDEHKEDEGDPHTKSARKHEHRALLFSEVEKRVKRSKVVVVSRARGAPG